MGNIPVTQVKGIFTKAYLQAYKETIPAPSFLRSFFTTKTFATKYVGIEVQRGTEKISADVIRGTDGVRNQFSLSSEKQYMPPFHDQNFDATDLDRYDRVFGASPEVAPATIGYLAADVAGKYIELRNKIERAKELQAAQVFTNGVVSISNGTDIDFKRSASSQVDLATNGGYWSSASATVEAQLIAGAAFIRQTGKNAVNELDLVMSGSAWVALKQTNYFQNVANFRQVQLVDIRRPQSTAFGAAYHGQLIAGAYIFNVWTYDEVYEVGAARTITRYMAANTAFMVPAQGTRFEMVHAGVPAIIRDQKNAEFPEYISNQASEYWLNNYIDPKGKTHTFEIMSAPLALPVTIDMMYTMQVLGDGGVVS